MSQLIDRLVVSRGPALITFGGGTFFSKEDIVVEFNQNETPIQSSAFGKLTDVRLGPVGSIKMTPIGEFEHLDVLWPYASTLPGTSIFGDADAPLVIKPLDEDQDMCTLHAAGIRKMPNLRFTAKDTLLGEMEWAVVGKNNTAVDNANRMFTFAANNIDLENLPYDPDKLLIQAYSNRWWSGGTFTLTFGASTTAALAFDSTAMQVQTALNALASIIAINDVTVAGNFEDGWVITFAAADENVGAVTGAITGMPTGTTLDISAVNGSAGVSEVVTVELNSPWKTFQSKTGVEVEFSATITEDETDGVGIYDMIFQNLDVTAKALPQGVPIATVLEAAAVQGQRSVRGTKLSTGAHNLIVSGDGVYFILYGANLKGGGMIRSSSNPAVPPLTWAASRQVGAGGIITPLFYIGEEAPE